MNYLCLTSRNEGLPGVVLEACSFGVPCIVSSETNMADYIQMNKAGFGIVENLPNQIADVLSLGVEKVSTIEYSDMKNNAINMISKIFDWKIITEKILIQYAKS
jgi:glycosyltransferase involved in cell wall biosynthesis